MYILMHIVKLKAMWEKTFYDDRTALKIVLKQVFTEQRFMKILLLSFQYRYQLCPDVI